MLRRWPICVLGGLSLMAGAMAEPVQMTGSDLLQAAVGERLMRLVQQNGMEVKVEFFGSVPALIRLKNQQSQLAIIAVPTNQRPPEGYVALPFCYQVDYILVNETNPITEVDRQQLGGVFGKLAEAELSRWEQLGLAGVWTARAIQPVATSADDGIVQELFRRTIMGTVDFKSGVRFTNTSAELVKAVADSNTVMALSGFNPGPPAKVLLVSMERNKAMIDGTSTDTRPKVAFPPTEENVYNGDYPLRLPFYVVYKAEDKAKLRDVLRVLYSEEFAGYLRDQHFMPVPATIRKNTLLQLDKAP